MNATQLLPPALMVLSPIGTMLLLVYLVRKRQLRSWSFALIFASGFTIATMGPVFLGMFMSEDPDLRLAVLFLVGLGVGGFIFDFGVALLFYKFVLSAILPHLSKRPTNEGSQH